MSQHSQFTLLGKRRFLPYFITQALGAFNDNLYKNALLLLIAFSGIIAEDDSALYTNLAAGLFILPFFLFSPIAGQIADKMEKSQLIRSVKLLEVAIMLIAAVGVITNNMLLMMTLLFLMGLQSALFGPVKFALLPQQLHKDELVGGNALVEMGTFLAILGGTITAGLLFDLSAARYWIAAGVVFFALAGYISSRFIPETAAGDPQLVINWNPFTELVNTLRNARQQRAVYLSIMAISWFWFLGASYLTQFPNLARDHLGGNPQIVTLLLTLFSVGVATGSLLCEKLSGHKIELGIVPIGSLGMSIFGIDLYFVHQQPEHQFRPQRSGVRTECRSLAHDGGYRADQFIRWFICRAAAGINSATQRRQNARPDHCCQQRYECVVYGWQCRFRHHQSGGYEIIHRRLFLRDCHHEYCHSRLRLLTGTGICPAFCYLDAVSHHVPRQP
ncbi:MAG: MFS transporter [Saccharospirillaceae bacterium]|nr:MFS transporter [Saccharospirillaceae bacterium]